MITEGSAKSVILLLLVSSSFSRSVDDTLKTLDAAVDDPAWTSAQHHPAGGTGGRLRRWNTASVDSAEPQNEVGFGGINATSDAKESKYGSGFGPSLLFNQNLLFQTAATTAAPATTPSTAGLCQLLAANAGITSPIALLTFLQQCANLQGLITAPTTTAPMTTAAPTTASTFTGVCQLLAVSTGITAPAALQTFLQQCAVLLGLIIG